MVSAHISGHKDLPDCEIRAATEADLEALEAIEHIAWDVLSTPMPVAEKPVFGTILPIEDTLVVETERKIIGYVTVGSRTSALLFSPYVVGRDSRYYYSPTAFLPERWLNEEWTKTLQRSAYFPFGGGPRFCLGRDFALIELILLVVVVAQKVRFSALENAAVVLDCQRSLIPKNLQLVVSVRK